MIFFGYSVCNSKLGPRRYRTRGLRARVEFGRAVESGRPGLRPYARASIDDGITDQRGQIGEHEEPAQKPEFVWNPRTGLVAAT